MLRASKSRAAITSYCALSLLSAFTWILSDLGVVNFDAGWGDTLGDHDQEASSEAPGDYHMFYGRSSLWKYGPMMNSTSARRIGDMVKILPLDQHRGIPVFDSFVYSIRVKRPSATVASILQVHYLGRILHVHEID